MSTSFNDSQLDALREIGNIGMGHAATALSQMLGETLYIKVPKVTVTDVAQIPELLGGPEKLVAGVVLQVLGDARGLVLMVFPEESALELLKRVVSRTPSQKVLDEIEESTLKEIGNILASAYLSALGSLMNKTMIPSIPQFAYDMVGAVIDAVLIDLIQQGEQAVMLEAVVYNQDSEISDLSGHFFLIPDRDSLKTIFKAVGVE
ncbi:MAG: CheY-P-specific phosphatase CheC [Desulfuromonas sp.]|nr:MAG: CheY-P-specific phosphatase CheC [Desulfuromonas sp.]